MKIIKSVSLLALISFQASAVPERPTIDRDVHMHETIQGEPQYIAPTIPPLQTSADGRIGVAHRPQNLRTDARVAFRLLVPEKLNAPFMNSAAGTEILAFPNQDAPNQATIPTGQILGSGGQAHAGLCDATLAPDNPGRNNPYACNANGVEQNNGVFDCYDLTLIRGSGNNGNASRTIYGIDVRVRVQNPKTVNAQISDVTVTNQTTGPTIPGLASFFEPTITSDGRMMVMRVGNNSNYTWYDNNGNQRNNGHSDITYIVPENIDNPAYGPCDVRQWQASDIRPMAHAPYDDTINTRYGLAMQPFRDSEGDLIGENYEFGSYPWMDKDGANIAFTGYFDSINNFTSRTGIQPSCVAGEPCGNNYEEGANFQGRSMMGLWTRGKMVVLDNQLNHTDFMLTQQRNFNLYDDGTPKRVGMGRQREYSDMPASNSANTNFFDTNEHRFNYHFNMRPVTPADVTWLMSTGRSTDEVKFDDYLNPNSFINANMTYAVNVADNNARGEYHNHIQNAATGGRPNLNGVVPNTEWLIPDRGRLLSNVNNSDARVEPISNGGIHGKGLWLDGQNDGIEFTIQAQSRNVLASNWYYSIFVDPRSVAGTRNLISFPDGSEIRLRGNDQIVFFNAAGAQLHVINSPIDISANAWSHIAFQLTNANSTIQTYVNGMVIDTYNTNNNLALFQLTPGDLLVGQGDANGFRGWIDDFKILAEQVNAEVACNHANGTLVGVLGNAANVWQNMANSYPASTHNQITNVLDANNEPSFNQYVCYHDYTADYAAHLGNIPNGLISVRESINFPEGPLLRNQPRPDSSQNAFCLSCHTEPANERPTLSVAALTFNANVDAPEDPRRQPMQPDPLVFGNIPANWLGQGMPAQAFVAPANGFNIDNLLLEDGQLDDNNGGNNGGDTGGNNDGNNGSDFPQPGENGWTTNGNTNVINDNGNSNVAHIDGAGSFNYNVALSGNTNYTLTVMARVANNGQSFWLGVTDLTTSTTLANTLISNTNYQLQTLTFTTADYNGDRNHNIFIWNNAGGDYYAHNFALEEQTSTGPVAPNQVELTSPVTELTVNETAQLTASVLPANTTDASVSYSSSNSALLSVNASGVITAHATSTAQDVTITATSDADPSLSDSVTIRVNPVNLITNSSFTNNTNGWTLNGAASAQNDNGNNVAFVDGAGSFNYNITLAANTQYTLTVRARVGNQGDSFYLGVTDISNANSPNNLVSTSVTNTGYQTHTLTFTTAGSARLHNIFIWNNDGGDYYADDFVLVEGEQLSLPTNITLTSPQAELTIGNTLQLNADITPNNVDDDTVIYQSSDTNIATVNSNGEVMAIAQGNVTITATTVNNLSATVVINIVTNNLIDNPDFSNGATGWTLNGAASVQNDNGNNVAFVDGAGSFNYNITLAANTQYTLTVRARVANNGQSFWLGVTDLSTGTTLDNELVTNSGGYQVHTLTFTTGNSERTHNIFMWNNQGGDYYADDFTLAADN
ncbi:Ig-like domain-containing protein [Catenovulum sediminis]|uniref:Ig-like domain-containing protein n=1 Tax=Catenovulum sediminis TaxID=1740262 RepID=A0ABV1RIM2_9ALTE